MGRNYYFSVVGSEFSFDSGAKTPAAVIEKTVPKATHTHKPDGEGCCQIPTNGQVLSLR